MKNFIKILFPIIIVIAVAYLGYRIVQLSQNKKVRKEKIAYIPKFNLKTMQGDIFTNSDLKQNVPTIFFYFNSDCDFCQAETEEIISNIKNLESIQIIFVSNESIQQILMFQHKYRLEGYDNVLFLCDDNNNFAQLLGLKSIPSSFIYSKTGVLLDKNNGPVKVDYLLKSIK